MYRVGCGKVDITPPLGMPYLGKAPQRHAPIRGVHDPLFARAACIEAGTTRAVIISADTIGFANTILGEGRSFIGEVKREIEKATGIPGSHVMVASNHIHSSAETLGFRPLSATYPEAHSWLEELQAALARCAIVACESTVETELRVATGAAPGLAYNRRGEESLDDEVTVLLFGAASGPEFVVVSYACHPVVVQAQELISADYVGAMIAAVEARLPGLRSCQFLLGACGDIDPSCRATRRFSDAEHMGRKLADEVLRLAASAAGCGNAVQPAVVKAALMEVNLPSRPLPSEEEARQLRGWVDAERRLAVGMAASSDKIARIEWAEEELVRIAEGNGTFPGEVQLVRLGDVVLIGLPGEVFCATGHQLKRLCEPLVGIPVGYANGYLGYLAPPEAWVTGGYETSLGPWSKVGPGAHAHLLDAVRRLLPQVSV